MSNRDAISPRDRLGTAILLYPTAWHARRGEDAFTDDHSISMEDEPELTGVTDVDNAAATNRR